MVQSYWLPPLEYSIIQQSCSMFQWRWACHASKHYRYVQRGTTSWPRYRFDGSTCLELSLRHEQRPWRIEQGASSLFYEYLLTPRAMSKFFDIDARSEQRLFPTRAGLPVAGRSTLSIAAPPFCCPSALIFPLAPFRAPVAPENVSPALRQ